MLFYETNKQIKNDVMDKYLKIFDFFSRSMMNDNHRQLLFVSDYHIDDYEDHHRFSFVDQSFVVHDVMQ